MPLGRDILRLIGLQPLRQPGKNHGRRGMTAGSTGRLTQDWSTSHISPDRSIYGNLVAVRTRARERAWNDDYARQLIRSYKRNIVGPFGFRLQVKARNADGLLDKPGNTAVEAAWIDWSRPEFCGVTGTMSLRMLEDLMIEQLIRDGEYLVRLVTRKSSPYGFALQLLPPEMLDERVNEKRANGNIVRMGVELDRERRPVAYHLRVPNEENDIYSWSLTTARHEVVPAEQIIHGFIPEYANQTRGISLMMTALWRLKMLSGFEEASLVNARLSAAKGMILSNSADSDDEDYEGDSADADGNTLHSIEPGMVEDIGNKTMVAWQPNYPSDQHGPFVKSMLRAVGAGVGVAYEGLANDRESVNYSSIRAGLVEEREGWKELQQWFIESTLNRIYAEWLDMALLAGAIRMDSGKALPFTSRQKFNQPQFTGKRWAWVDPQSDVEASKAAIAAGLSTPQRECAERGLDFEEVIEDLAAAQKLAGDAGVKLVYDPAVVFPPQAAAVQPGKARSAPTTAGRETPGTEAPLAEALTAPGNGNGHHH